MPEAICVAVQDSLPLVKQRLRAGGYAVVSTAGGIPQHIDAIVVDGLDDRVVVRQDVAVRLPVINAAGRTPEDVAAEVGVRARAAVPGSGRRP